jgi:hypothetical protein
MRTTSSTAGIDRASRAALLGACVALSCRFDPAYRDAPESPSRACAPGTYDCRGDQLLRCDGDETESALVLAEDCAAEKLVCAPTLRRCAPCVPGAARCAGADAQICRADGGGFDPKETCDAESGVACRDGNCIPLCNVAEAEHSNIGCEYWAVDLDNAFPDPAHNAAAQPFALVVSNAEPDVPAKVTVDVDDSEPGAPPAPRTVGTARVPPGSLEVFNLGSREVDGSKDGTYNTGTGTALTRHAFRVRSTAPIVAYQFNPFENANVFSNDASQLLPTSALGPGPNGRSYVIASWPQTIATTQDSSTNFGMDLRAFLTIVGTKPDTKVRIKTKAKVIPGGPLVDGLPPGGETTVTLQPFEVLNLETGGFLADFTGSFVDADQPVVVYAGSEASDAPLFDKLGNRFCCADHLEEQVVPVRAAGKKYVLTRMPNRGRAVSNAGAPLTPIDEPEIYRVVATRSGPTHVTTSLPPPDDAFDLADEGEFRTMVAHQDFTLDATNGVVVADVQVGQDAAGVHGNLPGGDPSLTFVPPVEQWRDDYVLLTPDKYAFDFLVFAAPKDARVFVDGTAVGPDTCETGDDGPWRAYRCQLSFPVVDANVDPPKISPGRQNDGVHRVQSDLPIGVVVYGFDAYVSYAYAGGTQLRDINVQ